uniref:Uncharacterized protein n=1 Tax=Picea sitchensis TaxID=3332 RepID=A0A6B9XV22_PICSI|nr:hypothetical protein Q903MT_gene3878 [Picea sitchensis]
MRIQSLSKLRGRSEVLSKLIQLSKLIHWLATGYRGLLWALATGTGLLRTGSTGSPSHVSVLKKPTKLNSA